MFQYPGPPYEGSPSNPPGTFQSFLTLVFGLTVMFAGLLFILPRKCLDELIKIMFPWKHS